MNHYHFSNNPKNKRVKSGVNILHNLYGKKMLPSWYVLIVDSITISFSFGISVLLMYNLNFESSIEWMSGHIVQFIISIFVYNISFFVLNSYSASIRYTSFKDLVKLFYAGTIAFVSLIFFVILGMMNKETMFEDAGSIFSILSIHYFISLFLLVTSRVIFRQAHERLLNSGKPKRNVVIYGAGTLGQITKNILEGDTSSNTNIIAFIDDDSVKRGKLLGGVPIMSNPDVLNDRFIQKNNIEEVVIAIDSITLTQKRAIVDQCLEVNLQVKQSPSVVSWINGELSLKQIKNVRIEDLLDRKAIELEKDNLHSEIDFKTILVSGAAGSIGSEIAKQVTYYNAEKLILLDQSETGLYDIERKLVELTKEKPIKLEVVIGDISQRDRVEEVFRLHQPDIIYHAAAYKHVPMMERNPSEAVNVNVQGSKNMADMAVKYDAEKFVMVSTDKAVNPTNVMGASKRLAEIYVQSLTKQHHCNTKFITTRFGNVLGSNGSVIPLFREQIEKGGPLTVTSDKITRYFMTIPEACQLVMEAGSMGNGGEIYVFDMGKPVKIIDLAKNMIKLSGLEVNKDIEIKVVGLRPGEKLYEELLNSEENTIPTHHPKILIGKVRDYDFNHVKNEFVELFSFINVNNYLLVQKMKDIVPEFVSKNSIYESIDKRKREGILDLEIVKKEA